MAEALKESTWTTFTKKLKLELDDGPLLKALARVDKTDESKPEPRIEALQALTDQIPKQVIALAKRKKDLGDKVFGEAKDKLYALLEEAEGQLKQARKALEEAGDDEADSPVLLTSKMIPLVRELRKGEVQMHALIGTAGKSTAVLIMRKAITSSRRKLLAEAIGGAGGAKYIAAECLLENKALTFVVQGQAAGLAKRLTQALIDQLGMRLKVRVRGEDGATDEDGADGDDVDSAGLPPAPPLPDAELQAFRRRMAQLEPRVAEAVAAQHPEATRLRALIGLASERAEAQGDTAGALRALDGIDKLLGAAPAPAASTAPPTPPTPPGGSGGGSLVNMQKARLAWLQTRQAVQTQLRSLEASILEEFKDADDYDEVRQDVRRLDEVMTVLDEELADTLDAALNAADEAERRRLQQAAREQMEAYGAYVASDTFVADLDANPFVPVKIRETVTRSLAVLSKTLA
jgi:hypothetical protein